MMTTLNSNSLKFLISGLFLLISVIGSSAIYAHNSEDSKHVMRALNPVATDSLLADYAISNNDVVKNFSGLYDIVLHPVQSAKLEIEKLPIKYLDQEKKELVGFSVRNGEKLKPSLTKEEADILSKQLEKLEAKLDIILSKTEVSDKRLLIRLESAGKNKNTLMKVIMKESGVSLGEALTIVNKLRIVKEDLTVKQALDLQRKLEAAGARVNVEEMAMRPAKSKVSHKRLLIRLESSGKNKNTLMKVIAKESGVSIGEALTIVNKLGIVKEDLTVKQALDLQRKLEAAGARVNVEEMAMRPAKSKVSDKRLLIRLESSGKNKNTLMKVIAKESGVSIGEALTIVNKLGIVKEDLTVKQALDLQRKLEAAGARVNVEEMGAKPAKSKVSDKRLLIRLESAGRNKNTLMKVIMKESGVGLGEALTIVNKLGIVKEDLSVKESLELQKKLEAAGARVKAEEYLP